MSQIEQIEKTPRVEVSESECKGCHFCADICPKKCISMSQKFNKLGYQYAVHAAENCIGCGFCFYTCPEPGALTVYKKVK
ncbi:MAG: 4Fe-4S dicluster domain-containing protein [Pseudomonadota bacterium]